MTTIADRAGTLALLAYTFGGWVAVDQLLQLRGLVHAGLRFPSLEGQERAVRGLDQIQTDVGRMCRAHEAWRS